MRKSVFAPILVTFIMAVMLGSVSRVLSSTEAENKQEELNVMLHNLLPHSVEFVEEPYTGEDANIRTVYKAENGYVIETASNGYAGEISMLVGVSNKGTVTGVVVRDLSETQGLGANAYTDTEFLVQFLNTNGNAEVVTAAGSDAGSSVSVDAMSGATVSSRAVARAVNSAVAFVTGADVTSGASEWGG